MPFSNGLLVLSGGWQWIGNAHNSDEWCDLHFRIAGPAVAQMQAVFTENWLEETGQVMHGEAWFPAFSPSGRSNAKVFSSSPSGNSESMLLMYLLSIPTADRMIKLSSACFVPEELTMRALADVLARGWQLRIFMPGKTIDAETVQAASRGGCGVAV